MSAPALYIMSFTYTTQDGKINVMTSKPMRREEARKRRREFEALGKASGIKIDRIPDAQARPFALRNPDI